MKKTTKKNLHSEIPARKTLGQNLGSSMLAVSSCCPVVRGLGTSGFKILDVWFYFGIGAAVNYKITYVCLLGNMNCFLLSCVSATFARMKPSKQVGISDG